MQLAVIGGGKMGEALIAGVIAAGLSEPGQISVVEVDPARRAALESIHGISVSEDADTAVDHADAVLIAVKPADVPACLGKLRGALAPATPVISIAAGVTTSTIESQLAPGQPVVRAMPNLGATVGAGAAAVAPGTSAGAEHLALALEILGAVGRALVVDEDHLDAVTALSGSGPAYVFKLAEAMTEAGVAAGLERDVAVELTVQTILGAARLLAEQGPLVEGGPGAAQWREAVTSKGGTTAAALDSMSAAGFDEIVTEAILAARARAAELNAQGSA